MINKINKRTTYEVNPIFTNLKDISFGILNVVGGKNNSGKTFLLNEMSDYILHSKKYKPHKLDSIKNRNRIITYLESSENGYLMIESVERELDNNNLKENLKLLYEKAEELKVQIYAIAYSSDCFRAVRKLQAEFGEDKIKLLETVMKKGEIAIEEK